MLVADASAIVTGAATISNPTDDSLMHFVQVATPWRVVGALSSYGASVRNFSVSNAVTPGATWRIRLDGKGLLSLKRWLW